MARFPKRTYRVDKDGRPVFGQTEDGELLYWPDIARLTIDVPPPLEQYLERLAREGHLGESPADVAIFLLRDGLMERFNAKHRAPWRPDPWRYMERKKTPKGGA